MLIGAELAVLKLMADGKNTKEIAYMLGISVEKVLSHRAHLIRRLGVHDAASLVRYAVWNGLLIP
jgi:DNA-binding CsgD family transcriptional regulator